MSLSITSTNERQRLNEVPNKYILKISDKKFQMADVMCDGKVESDLLTLNASCCFIEEFILLVKLVMKVECVAQLKECKIRFW